MCDSLGLVSSEGDRDCGRTATVAANRPYADWLLQQPRDSWADQLNGTPPCRVKMEQSPMKYTPARYTNGLFGAQTMQPESLHRAYPEDPAEFKPLTEDELQRIKKERRQKETQRKQRAAENRKHLANVRVVQKNLVFVVGLSQRLAEPDVLRKHDYFGKFGKIHKVVINQSTSYAGAQGPSASAYVTYTRPEDALRAIQTVNNIHVDGRTIKASLGTTKYCSHFLRGSQCPKPDCMYLHELGDESASFTKEEMQQGKHQEYEQKLYEHYMNCQNLTNQPTPNTVPTAPTTTTGKTQSRKKAESPTQGQSSQVSANTGKEVWPSLNIGSIGSSGGGGGSGLSTSPPVTGGGVGTAGSKTERLTNGNKVGASPSSGLASPPSSDVGAAESHGASSRAPGHQRNPSQHSTTDSNSKCKDASQPHSSHHPPLSHYINSQSAGSDGGSSYSSGGDTSPPQTHQQPPTHPTAAQLSPHSCTTSPSSSSSSSSSSVIPPHRPMPVPHALNQTGSGSSSSSSLTSTSSSSSSTQLPGMHLAQPTLPTPSGTLPAQRVAALASHHAQLASQHGPLSTNGNPTQPTSRKSPFDIPTNSMSLFSSNGFPSSRNPKPVQPPQPTEDSLPSGPEISDTIAVSSSTDWQAAFGFVSSAPATVESTHDDDLGFDPWNESAKALAEIIEKENSCEATNHHSDLAHMRNHHHQHHHNHHLHQSPTHSQLPQPQQQNTEQQLPSHFQHQQQILQQQQRCAQLLAAGQLQQQQQQPGSVGGPAPLPDGVKQMKNLPPGFSSNHINALTNNQVNLPGSKMLGLMHFSGIPPSLGAYQDVGEAGGMNSKPDGLSFPNQNPDLNVKDWQDGLRALLPNINISFGAHQDQATQAVNSADLSRLQQLQQQQQQQQQQQLLQNNMNKNVNTSEEPPHWMASLQHLTEDTIATNHRVPLNHQHPLRGHATVPSGGGGAGSGSGWPAHPPPGFHQNTVRLSTQVAAESPQLAEGLQ